MAEIRPHALHKADRPTSNERPTVVVPCPQRPESRADDEEAATTIRRRNPRKQGEIGLGAAIAWFADHGWSVSIPLADNQPYDLVVDEGDGPKRVQVKTTTHRTPYGRYAVQLNTRGGNQSLHTAKPFDPANSDLLFVLTDDRSQYLIPTGRIAATREISLGALYEQYRLDEKGPGGEPGPVVGGGFEPPKA